MSNTFAASAYFGGGSAGTIASIMTLSGPTKSGTYTDQALKGIKADNYYYNISILFYSQTWDQKHNALLNLINADDTMERSYVDRFLFTSMITSFENEWDIMPKGRKKTIHPVGAHCPFKIDITPSSPYTGLLKVLRGFLVDQDIM